MVLMVEEKTPQQTQHSQSTASPTQTFARWTAGRKGRITIGVLLRYSARPRLIPACGHLLTALLKYLLDRKEKWIQERYKKGQTG